MSACRVILLRALVLACLTGALASCEKTTHESARRAYQSIQSADLGPADQAKALEEFVARYPEAKTNDYLVRACRVLADHNARLGRHDIAASWYERALRADPDDPDLMNALGYFYAVHGMAIERAIDLLETAVHLADEQGFPARRRGFIRDSLGWAYRARGDLALSAVFLEEADRMAPKVPIIIEHLADTYRALGEREKSAALYLELYLRGRATDARLKTILLGFDRPGSDGPSLGMSRRIAAGLGDIVAADRAEAIAAGGTLVELISEDGGRLRATLFLPPGGGAAHGAGFPGRRAGVILFHALGSDRQAAAPLARALAARGLVAVALDLRGHGASVSEAIPDSRQFAEALTTNMKAAAGDARTALAFLDRHPRIDHGRIGMVGAGMGALLAAQVLEGAGRRRALGLVLMSPWGPPEAYTGPLERIAMERVLTIAGAEEDSAAATARALAESRAGAAAPVVVPGAGSGYDLTARRPDLETRIVTFLAEQLR
jgi:dienelactone hydrolase/Tfp pilus assembly protein PilF